MSICHLHIFITNKTAVDISEPFREESKPRRAQTSPLDSHPARLPPVACQEEPARHGTCSAHVWWGRCWKEATLGKKQGEI